MGGDPAEALVLVARRAAELTGAAGALIVTAPRPLVPTEDDPPPGRVLVSVGIEDVVPVGSRVGGPGSVPAAATRSPRVEDPLDVDIDGHDVRLGEGLVVPVREGDEVRGVLVVVRPSGPAAASRDPDADLPVVTSFADQAALALRLAESQRAHQQLALVADRERIAADLHDQVLQRLFALGLGLQATRARLGAADEAGRVADAVDQIDAIVRDIRTTIFDLHTVGHRPGLGGRLRAAVAETSRPVDLEPVVRLTGPIDDVPEEIAAGVEAVVREGVSNAVRHAAPSSVIVTVSVDDVLTVEVTDDGVGVPAAVARSGLANLAARARAGGGDLALAARDADGGTRLTWWVPMPPPVAGAVTVPDPPVPARRPRQESNLRPQD